MKKLIIASIAMIAVTTVSCGKKTELMMNANKIFKPVLDKMPGSEGDTPELVELGKKLYFDNALSVNDTQSCNSCHRLDEKRGGDDGNPVSPGAIGGKFGGRNAPTTLNAGFHLAQFWDGRAADLKAQAKGPILNPVEMGMPTEGDVVEKIKGMEEYQKMFGKVFHDEKDAITYDNIAHAIAAFERTLHTHDRFDDFLNGDNSALSDAEKKGLETFMKTGCIQCHNGMTIGGNSYQKMGVFHPYENKSDMGRYDVTKNDTDKYVFKVPSLRNIALTAPYFHDGKVETLEEAVKLMGKLQLNKDLNDEEIKSIVTFLKSLTDKTRI